MPTTNADYWREKIARNVKRYSSQINELTTSGWKALTLWECELRDQVGIAQRLKTFIDIG